MDIETIFHSAMLNEWDGLEYYKRAAELISDPRGKKMIKTLADDEKDHIRVIAAQYEAVMGGSGLLSLVEAKAKCPSRSPAQIAKKYKLNTGDACTGLERIFPPAEEAKKLLRNIKTDIQVLEVALGFERRGHQIYANAAMEVSDPLGKEVLQWLAKEEDKHYKLVQSAIEYLNANGLWWDKMYMPPLEG